MDEHTLVRRMIGNNKRLYRMFEQIEEKYDRPFNEEEPGGLVVDLFDENEESSGDEERYDTEEEGSDTEKEESATADIIIINGDSPILLDDESDTDDGDDHNMSLHAQLHQEVIKIKKEINWDEEEELERTGYLSQHVSDLGCPVSGGREAMLRKVQEPKLRDVQEPKFRKVQEPKLRKVQGPKLRDVQELKLRDVQEPKLRKVQEPKLRDAQEPKLRDAQEPKLRAVQEPKLRDVQEPKLRKVQEPRLRKVQEPKHSGDSAVGDSVTKANGAAQLTATQPSPIALASHNSCRRCHPQQAAECETRSLSGPACCCWYSIPHSACQTNNAFPQAYASPGFCPTCPSWTLTMPYPLAPQQYPSASLCTCSSYKQLPLPSYSTPFPCCASCQEGLGALQSTQRLAGNPCHGSHSGHDSEVAGFCRHATFASLSDTCSTEPPCKKIKMEL